MCLCADAPARARSNIRLAVLDLDGGVVGGALVAAASHAPYSVTVLPASTTLTRLVADVDHGDFHAALVAQPGATAALAAARAAGAASAYDATGAVTLLFDEGGCGAALSSMLRASSAQLVAAASAGVERRLFNTSVAPAVGLSVLPLHPVAHAGMNLSGGIAFILC